MMEIYFIPDLKNNIINFEQATKVGCDIQMKNDYMKMHDVDGCLLMKVKRNANWL